MRSNFKYYIDAISYKDTKNERYIRIEGWCYHPSEKDIEFQVRLNSKPMDCMIDKYPRTDLANILPKDCSHYNYGFLIHLPLENQDVQSLQVDADCQGEHIILTTVSQKKFEQLRDTHECNYSIDGFERKKDTQMCSIFGWAYTNTHENIEYIVKDEKGNVIPFTIRHHKQTDLVAKHLITDEFANCGFYIVFQGEENQSYTLTLQTKSDSLCIQLNDYYRHDSGIMKIIESMSIDRFRRAGSYLKRNGLKKFVKRVAKGVDHVAIDYNDWTKLHMPSQKELDIQRHTKFAYAPKVSLIVATFNTPLPYLKEMIGTVEQQTYSNWELCIADGSTDDAVENYVKEHYGNTDKVKFIRLDQNYGIAGNMNEAIKIATGDFIALYDHDDTLVPYALYEYIKVLNDHPSLEVIYSDEDKTNSDGTRVFEPHFKPDFNFDLLCTTNYICHFLLVKKTLIDQVGMLKSEYDGAQDYDFILRCTDAAGVDKIHHIPKVLYHWRFHENSTAGNPESKMYAFEAGLKAVQDFYTRKGIHATVEHGPSLGMYRTKYILDTHPLVSILIPTKDHIDDLSRCIESIEHTATYDNYEIIVIENNSTEAETFAYYDRIQKEYDNIRVVVWDGIFNYSAINNFGAQYAKGEYLWLLNNDTQVITPNVMEELLGFCMRSDVGAVGARLYYPDDTIQHAGVIIGLKGIAGHAFVNTPRESLGYFGRIVAAQDYSAVTAACMMVKRKAFDQVQGLTEELKVAFNDIDFCLKLQEKGYRIVYNPYAELYHFESKSRGEENTVTKVDRFNDEISYFEKRWATILKEGDPYYNPNLTLKYNDFSLNDEV